MIKKVSDFIEKAIKKHNDRYDYSKVNYIDLNTKIEVGCKIHGYFWVIPRHHLNNKVGCLKCNGGYKYTQEEFIEKCKLVHGYKYKYDLVKYINSQNKIKIICPEHGIFSIRPPNHLALKQGCRKCSKTERKTTEIFIKQAIKAQPKDRYDYSLVNYINNRIKVKIICKIHGSFEQNPKDHLNGHGCKYCNKSKSEQMIEEILKERNINFESEHLFKECRGIQRKLPFDFYLPDYNTCIEFDGRQHFEPINIFGGEEEFIKLKINDKVKDKFCKDNNINLLRISYKEDIISKINYFLDSSIIDT